MKQADLLSFYRSEVRRSKKWRSDEGYDDDWKRYIDLYRGKQYDASGNGIAVRINTTPVTYRCVTAIHIYPLPK